MPKFYVHQIDNDRRTHDEMGAVFASLDAVKAETQLAAPEMMVDQFRGGAKVDGLVLKIGDEYGNHVDSVRLPDLMPN